MNPINWESSDLEIDLTLAEFVGWKWWKHTKSKTYILGDTDCTKESLDDDKMQWENCPRPNDLPEVFSDPPSYIESLDNCFLVEDELDLKQMDAYATNLWHRTQKDMPHIKSNLNMYVFAHASSRQRATSLYEILKNKPCEGH